MYAQSSHFERHTQKTRPALINLRFCEEELLRSVLLHIEFIQERTERGVFYCPAFFKGGNNDPANEFVQKSMGSREMIPIPGTRLVVRQNLLHTIHSLSALTDCKPHTSLVNSITSPFIFSVSHQFIFCFLYKCL